MGEIDIVYYNFNTHGLSLQLKPERGYRPLKSQNVKREDLQENKMILSAIDIYCDKFKDFPLPLTHPLRQRTDSVAIDDSHLETTEITTTMTGEQLVDALGEPDRKGGGESKSIGVWLEWTGLGLMCEFGSIHGAGRWDKANGAGNAQVSVWTFFEPGQSMGQETEE